MKNKVLKDILLLLVLILYLIIGHIYHIYIPCVFHKLTGLYCPGCGLTRMLYSIIKLDFYAAFRYNPLLFILFPFGLVLFINYVISLLKNKQPLYLKVPDYIWYILIILLIIYGIVRNIYVPLQPIN